MRLIAPGKQGYKWVQWIVPLEVIDYDCKGFWESRGWDDDADRTVLSDWLPHAVSFSVGGVLGFPSILGGLKYSRFTDFWRRLPRWFTSQRHNLISYAYYAIIFPTFDCWVIATWYLRGDVFYSIHGLLALTVISLHSLGGVTGIGPGRAPRWRRGVHLASNALGCLLFLGTVITGSTLALGVSITT